MPTLELRPDDFVTADGRREALIHIATRMLWPLAETTHKQAKGHARHRSHFYLAVKAYIDEKCRSAGTNENISPNHSDHVRALTMLHPHFFDALRRGLNAGEALVRVLDSNDLAGFGFRMQGGGVLGLPKHNLNDAIVRAYDLNEMSPAAKKNKIPAHGATIFEKKHGSLAQQRWGEYRTVAHLWAAHIAFGKAHPHRRFNIATFPCGIGNMLTFLRTAEKIRGDAINFPRFESKGQWVLSDQMRQWLQKHVPLTPATISRAPAE
ncbi:MAG: hypothetical protein ACLQUZ_15685 [Rhizomicrobium sp.]